MFDYCEINNIMNAKISDSPILMLNIFQLIGGGNLISQEKTSQLISLPFFIICFLILLGEHLVK